MAQEEAGGCISLAEGEERGAEFPLAEVASRVGCWLAGGEAWVLMPLEEKKHPRQVRLLEEEEEADEGEVFVDSWGGISKLAGEVQAWV